MKEIVDAVLAFDQAETIRLIEATLDHGTAATSVLQEGLIAAMDEVGRRYSEGLFFVPEMLMAAEAMKAGLGVLRPRLSAPEATPGGTVVIGTVKGDQHDIGKNLVAMMLECAGFKVINLGVDVAPNRFLAMAKRHDAQVIAMSALLTTTLPAMEATVARVKRDGGRFKTMVGGAPVTQILADKIGADGYSPDAAGAITIARNLASR
ncbi:MAG TPA: corrinoid protein [Syntrophobacteria bacterium]|nr:corrinoid protein [Syntrophobacteria bacterium]